MLKNSYRPSLLPGKRVVVISGDLEGPVERMANKLGFASENVYSRCSPTRKLEIVRELQRGGQKVCYVGDGANDAAALAASDISIAIGGGADIAQATADIIIGSDRRLKASMVAALRLAKTNRVRVVNPVQRFRHLVGIGCFRHCPDCAAMGWTRRTGQHPANLYHRLWNEIDLEVGLGK
jgi:magnesium-transporting ATPase (P-type)